MPDEVLLFRYSALTFNGHRIHYDRRYATEVEGYPGLIVHGPLDATLLVGLLRSQLNFSNLACFEFRAVSTVFDIFPFEVCGKPSDDGSTVELWARQNDGALPCRLRRRLLRLRKLMAARSGAFGRHACHGPLMGCPDGGRVLRGHRAALGNGFFGT